MKPIHDDAILAGVIDAIAKELRVAPEDITLDTDLARDLSADSLDALNIAVRLEQSFAIKIPDAVLRECRTVASIAQKISRSRGEEPAAEGGTAQ